MHLILQVYTADIPFGHFIAFVHSFVHSGAKGEIGEACPRVHLYCEPDREADSTSPVEHNPHLQGLFSWHHIKGNV
jgi:hypothetical protein